MAIRYDTEEGAGTQGVRLFGEVVLPVCSPRLLRDARRALKAPQDLRHHCMLHMDTGPGSQLLEWPMWLRAMKIDALKPASVLHFSMYDQMIQAAVNGQGVALGRLPLLNSLLAQRKLVAPFKKSVASARSYYVFRSDASRAKPEVKEFANYYIAHAAKLSKEVKYVPLPERIYKAGLARLNKMEKGTVFAGHADVGVKIDELFSRKLAN